jgi:predicted O-linked N-acetylglucosamine transferase (SPINDLY family)
LPREYFFLPCNQLVIGCVQSLSKVHPDLDLIIEDISRRVPDAWFAFICDRDDNSTARFRDRLTKRAPTASKRTLFLDRCFSRDFLSLCDCFDFMLDTPYYGAGITSYMSFYVGTPVVCFQGRRLRDSTTAAIYRYLKINNAPVAISIPDYVNIAVQLSMDFDLRLQIKKNTVSAAATLYDQQDYIKSFEKFCINLVHEGR